MKEVLKTRSIIVLVLVLINPTDAFLEGFAVSISQMNEQMTKFMEGVHESVDSWANKVIENAQKEECFFVCPKGLDPKPKENYTMTPTGCITLGMTIKDEDLPMKSMRKCCDLQQTCYHHCNSTKTQCDYDFQQCLHKKCVEISDDDFKQVFVCHTATKLLLMGILSFGCKTFKDAQREACICPPINMEEL